MINGEKFEPQTPEYATNLKGVTVKGARRPNRPYLELIERSPNIYENLVTNGQWDRIAEKTGEQIEEWFINYINKNPEHYRYLSSKYIDMRLGKYGGGLSGAGELFGALLSFADYSVAHASNRIAPLPTHMDCQQ